jgi:cell division protein FtsB
VARAKRPVGRRILIVAGAVGIGWFAVQGGEYSTFDLFSLSARHARVEAEVAELTRVVDSLTKWKVAILTDPMVQEHLAREEFGMVRGNREFLYRFVEAPADSR